MQFSSQYCPEVIGERESPLDLQPCRSLHTLPGSFGNAYLRGLEEVCLEFPGCLFPEFPEENVKYFAQVNDADMNPVLLLSQIRKGKHLQGLR